MCTYASELLRNIKIPNKYDCKNSNIHNEKFDDTELANQQDEEPIVQSYADDDDDYWYALRQKEDADKAAEQEMQDMQDEEDRRLKKAEYEKAEAEYIYSLSYHEDDWD